MLARSLGSVNYFSEPEARALLDLKQKWGLADPRLEMQNCDICANDVFRESWKASGVKPKAFQPPTCVGAAGDADQEALIQAITDRVMETLNQR